MTAAEGREWDLSAEQVDARQDARAAAAWLLGGPPTDRALDGWGVAPSRLLASTGNWGTVSLAMDLAGIERDAPLYPDGTVPVAGQPGVRYVRAPRETGTIWEQAQAAKAADPNPERYILAAEAAEDRRAA